METLVNTITERGTRGREFSEIELLKIRYGVEVILITVIKLIPTLIIAYLMNGLWIAAVYIFSFSFIRRNAFGYHAKTPIKCFILSNVMIISANFISRYKSFSFLEITIIFIVAAIALYKYAPGNTEKRKIKSAKKRKKLRDRSLISILVLYVVCLAFIGYQISGVILVGVVISSFMATPMIYKILRGW